MPHGYGSARISTPPREARVWESRGLAAQGRTFSLLLTAGMNAHSTPSLAPSTTPSTALRVSAYGLKLRRVSACGLKLGGADLSNPLELQGRLCSTRVFTDTFFAAAVTFFREKEAFFP